MQIIKIMALVRCSRCGNFVSENAWNCPKCGNPMGAGMASPQYVQGQNYPAPNYQNPNYQNPNYQAPNYQSLNVSPKSKTAAGLLALFLGGLGIHYFYLGKPVPGIVFILLCWTWIPALLAFIQGIIMLTMSQQQFDQKYVYTQSSFPLF